MPASIRSACKHTPLPGHIEGLHATPMLVRCGGAGPGRYMLGSQGPWWERDQGAAARRVRQAEAANMAVSLLLGFVALGLGLFGLWPLELGSVRGGTRRLESGGDAWVSFGAASGTCNKRSCTRQCTDACMPAFAAA